jgi:hypothetical protein
MIGRSEESMKRCTLCGNTMEDSWGCCMVCRTDVANMIEWNEGLEQADNLHWLARAQRRIEIPIESSDEIPFLAIEYSWKVLNRLYGSLPVEKIRDPKTGKMRDENARERIVRLFDNLNVIQEIIDANKLRIDTLCKCILEEGGDITFEDGCQTLAASIRDNNYKEAAEALIKTLYSVRNARVHAQVSEPGQRDVGGEVGSNVRIRGPGEKDEVYTIAEILLSIGKILIRARTQMPKEHIEIIVRSRVFQLAQMIYERVKSWERTEICLPLTPIR